MAALEPMGDVTSGWNRYEFPVRKDVTTQFEHIQN